MGRSMPFWWFVILGAAKVIAEAAASTRLSRQTQRERRTLNDLFLVTGFSIRSGWGSASLLGAWATARIVTRRTALRPGVIVQAGRL